MTRIPAGEILPGNDIVQVFTATVDHLAVIAPQVGTYFGRARGRLCFSLHEAGDTPGVAAPLGRIAWRRLRRQHPPRMHNRPGAELATHVEDAGELDDNEPVEIPIEPIAGSRGRQFALRIRASDATGEHGATVWLADDEGRIPGHVACFVGGRLAHGLGIVADVLGAPPQAETPVPAGLLFSPVTRCNLNCIHCVSRPTRATAHRLPDAIRLQMRQWCRDGHLTSLACDYSGDILWADARFGGELDFIFSLGIPFQIDTNGVHLSSEVAHRLLRSRLWALNVSLDAATEETYGRIRRGAPPLGTVLANIRDYVALHEATGATFPISISMTLMRSDLDEWPVFIRLAARLGIGLVQTRHLESYAPEMDAESLWFDQARFNDVREAVLALAAAEGVRLYAPPPFVDRPPRTGHRLCLEPWQTAVLLGNGDVAACCVPDMIVGNLHEQAMEAIWRGERYQALRRTVNSAAPPAPCRACTYHRRHDNPGALLFHRAMRAQPADAQHWRLEDFA